MPFNEQVRQSQFFQASGDIEFPLANVSARDFQNIALQVSASGGADFWVRVKGSNQVMNQGALVETPPDFTVAVSPTNNWEYIELKPDDNGSFIPGATGFHITADGTYIFELNVSVLSWVALEIFNYASGDCLAQFIFKNNI
jgi:hypothetical protein